MKHIIYKNHTIKIICQPGGGKVACESFLFSFKRCPRINPSWKQTGPALMETALLTRQLPSLLWWIHTEAWRQEGRKPSFSLRIASSGESHHSRLSCALKFTKCASCYQRWLEKKKKDVLLLVHSNLLCWFLSLPYFRRRRMTFFCREYYDAGAHFFFNTAISSISLTVNVSFTTLQPPKFGRQFLLGCVLLSGVSMASFVRIMNF